MTAPAHAWMPVSSCESRCIDTPVGVGTVRAVTRVLRVVGLLMTFPVAHVVTPRTRRAGVQRAYARALLRSCGVRLRIIDNRRAGQPGGAFRRYADGQCAPVDEGVLVVAGHVSWLDVPVLAAVQPMSFVARGDLIAWPMLGELARLMRVIPIDRERLRQLPEVVGQISTRLSAGEMVGVFPEGTTWCGRGYGSLRPALFQAAVDTASVVQPVRLRYLDGAGELTTLPGFVGSDSMVDSIRRLLRSPGLVAEVVLAPLEQPGTNRRELAARCERAVRGENTLMPRRVGSGRVGAHRMDVSVERAS